jgi:hypothetical protein
VVLLEEGKPCPRCPGCQKEVYERLLHGWIRRGMRTWGKWRSNHV